MKRLIRILLVIAAVALALKFAIPVADPVARGQGGVLPQSSAPSLPKSNYLGNETCAVCHTEIAEKQQKAAMAKAMEKVADCRILRMHQELKFQLGKFIFKIIRRGDQSIYTVSDGKSELSVPILYAFGQGKAGQTYVYGYLGNMYESRVSFYTEINGLDITLGYDREVPQNVIEAAGRQMSVDETRRCFGCHTTGGIPKKGEISQLQLDHLVPGVSCESCHGPGDKHVAAMRAGDLVAAKMKKLSDLDGDDITQNMCGSCHRSVEDVMALPNRGGVNNVRFQPYRIFNSRCYSADKRIGCTSCHNPHEPTQTSPAFYDEKCLACHVKQGSKPTPGTGTPASDNAPFARACKVGKKDCAGCHMPAIELPGAHFKFTDHRIRIVREGAPFPN